MTKEDIQLIIQTDVSDGRYVHILRVISTARELAGHWHLDIEKAALAALIHDAAKSLNPTDLRTRKIIVNDYLDAVYRDYSKVWHALISDQYAEIRFGITDRDVLSAAKWHTTGRAKMSPLEQVIFIADYIEPGRKVKPREYIEKLAYNSLDSATFALSTETLRHLLQKGAPLHPYGIECREYYRTIVNETSVRDICKTLFSL